MNRKATIVSALGLICIAATGCVSGGGSYVAYETRPHYGRIDTGHHRPPPRADRHDRDQRHDWRRDSDRRDRDRPHASRPGNDRDGRWVVRNGHRIWVPGR